MSATLKSTPAADGFRMPGEFEPHSGCWMAWPERPDNWRLGAEAGAGGVRGGGDGDRRLRAGDDGGLRRASSSTAGRCCPPTVRVVELSTDDAWMRDTGPTFVVDGKGGRRGVDWRFNAWGGLDGGLYFPWDRDDRVAAKVLEVEGADRYRAPIVLEGGAIHVDGEGTVLTTEECLLNPNRNPELSREQIERALLDHLGAEKVVWLGARRLRRRDRRPRRQPRLLRPARGGAADLDRRPGRPPARDLARRARAARSGDRRPRSLASKSSCSPPPARCRPQPRRPRASTPARAPSRAAPATASPPPTSTSTSATRGSSIRCSTRATTRRPRRSCAAPSPTARSSACRPARSSSAAATSTASPSRCRRRLSA